MSALGWFAAGAVIAATVCLLVVAAVLAVAA